VTLFFPDISDRDAGVSFDGLPVIVIKATEGTNYTNPDYAPALGRARAAGAYPVAYHFLHPGGGAAQAEYTYGVTGKTPLMLDVEATDKGNPTLADATEYIDTYRRLGGICFFVYLPNWYWTEVLLSASLTPMTTREMMLWSSAYDGTYSDADTAQGWLPYGGIVPTIWQYTDTGTLHGQSPIDWNAFRGHFAGKQDPVSIAAALGEFTSLATTGKYPVVVPPYVYGPPTELKAAGGRASARLTWNPPAPVKGIPAPAEYKVWIYKGTTCDASTLVASYPRVAKASPWEGDSLAEGVHTAHVSASGPDGSHASPDSYASVMFTTG